MEKKLLAIIALVMIASLSVAGCTVTLPSTTSPTPTRTPTLTSTPARPADYSSHFDKGLEGGNTLTFSNGTIVKTGPIKIVCIGDSVTAGIPYALYGTGTSQSYPTYLATRLGPTVTVINKGKGGDQSNQVLARFKTDVIDLNPDFVIILTGLNDVGQGGIGINALESNLTTMCNDARTAGITPVLCTITPSADRAANISKANSWINNYGAARGIRVIDFHTPLWDPSNHDAINPNYDDGIGPPSHPNDVGLHVMAASIRIDIFNLPAPTNGLDSGTAVCSWGAGRLDVFATGTDGNLKQKWWDGTWHGWEDLGAPSGGLTSAPTAVSWGAGRIDVFARDRDGDLQHKWFDNGWSGWESLGVPAGQTVNGNTAPAAGSWGPGRLDIFVTGSDGQLWQKWFENGWQAWVPLGKPSAGLAGSPGALSTASWAYPRVDIFVRGADGALWQKWFGYGKWQPWHRFDDTVGLLPNTPVNTVPTPTPSDYYGYYSYAPAVCSWGANRLDVFFVDNSGNLQQKWFNGNWQPLYQVGGDKYVSAGPSAVTWQLGGATRIDIFARGDDFALWQLYYAGGWNDWSNLGLM